MATQTLTLTATSAAMAFEESRYLNENGPKVYDMAPTSALPGQRHLLFNFPNPPDAIKYYRILRSHLSVRCGDINSSAIFKTYALQRFDAQTITWNELESYTKEVINSSKGIYNYDSGNYVDFPNNDEEKTWVAIAKNKAIAIVDNGETLIIRSPTEIYGGADSLWPLFVIEYDDETIVPLTIKYAAGPRAGEYADRTQPITFSWITERASGQYCLEDQTQTDAVFKWRVSGAETWNEINPTAPTEKSVTVPANTFPTGQTIQWLVTVTGSSGQQYNAEYVYSFTTTDSAANAMPVVPNGTVEDGSAPIIFRWTTSNPTGSAPTGADLQSWVNNAWADMAHVDGPATTYTLPANILYAGTKFWRVRAYNADGVAGPWSSFVSFTVVAAPTAPTVSATSAPFSTISWQGTGQQAWRAMVDGKKIGPYFGTDKSFTLRDYLEDGEHTATVEVQGQYGLWSEPGTYTFTVQNVPGDDILLQADFGIDAALSWAPASPTQDYLIYRDGVQIGHTAERFFSDRVVQGEHEYFVINRLAGGYYSKSNSVQGEISTEEPMIAMLSGGAWLSLEKSSIPTRQEMWTATQTVELFHYAGRTYPEAEVSPSRTAEISFDVAWTLSERAEAAAFEAMIAKPVIFKAPSGETAVGILSTYSKQVVHFYRAYTATLRRIGWRDYVETG